MVTRADYPKDEVEACLSVMVEVMTVLGEFRDSIALVGGWVPYFLIEEKKEEHTGSLDIDIAFDFEKISDRTYQTILQLLESRGYGQGEQPFIFKRIVPVKGRDPVTVEINLLAREYGGTGKSRRTQRVQDVRARKARGCDLVFEHTFSTRLRWDMPDGARNEVLMKVANALPFLVMKGMALWDRYKEKDAYDIYFSVLHYPGGIRELAKAFEPFKANRLVLEGLGKIKARFNDVNAPGPVWVANFLEIDDEEEKERIKRDVFERVNAFLEALDIKPFQKGS
jgi:hypothetical protein